MKKRLLLITALLVSFMMGCSKPAESGKVFSGSITQAVYYPFEEIMKFANEAVLAKCIKIHSYPEGYSWIEFKIEKRYFGEESEKNIFIYCENTIIEMNEYGYSYEKSDSLYEEGKLYYLVLSRFINPITEHHDVYSPLVDLIPFEGIADKSLFYGKSPSECNDMLFCELTKSTDNIDAYLTNFDASENPLYRGRKYIETDDETEIIKNSDYILQVVIMEKTMEDLSLGKDFYECVIINSIKGDFEQGWDVTIGFPKNSVTKGEEFIIALNYVCEESEKNNLPEPQNHWLLAPSSLKLSLSMSEEEIMNVLHSQSD